MKLYKFYKKNCAPCYAMERRLVQIGIPENVELIPMDVGVIENLEIAKEFGLEKVPVLMFEDGRKLEGMRTAEELRSFLGVENEISN